MKPLTQKILNHLMKTGSISAREAMEDYGITSASLSKRICEIEESRATIGRIRRRHPITGRRYTRYHLGELY